MWNLNSTGDVSLYTTHQSEFYNIDGEILISNFPLELLRPMMYYKATYLKLDFFPLLKPCRDVCITIYYKKEFNWLS